MKAVPTLILAFYIFGSFAQEPADTKAKAILDELSVKTKLYKTIKADFTITIESKDKKGKETQNASVILKGDKYKLQIKGQEVISDGKTVWTFLTDANEVQINNVEVKNTEAITPANMFTIYETGYKYKFEKEELQGKKTMQIVCLYPLNPDKKKFHTLKLFVDKTKKQIAMLKILMKDGGLFTYAIKTFMPNQEINDAVFTYDAKTHPGAEVVDLR